MENVTVVKKEDFIHLEQVGLSSDALLLEDGCLEGTALSHIFEGDPFNACVTTWKTQTTQTSSVEVMISVCVEGNWSDWLSYGIWQKSGALKGGLKSQACKDLKLMVDLLKVNAPLVANAFKLKVVLRRQAPSEASPIFQQAQVSKALQVPLEEDLKGVESFDLDKWSLNHLSQEAVKESLKIRDLPAYSQMLIPDIGRVICSPTSVTMLLNYYGFDISVEETAAGVKDYQNEIYGNWAFNMAFAGECGFNACVEVAHSKTDLLQMMAKGLPFAMSIRSTEPEAIKGAPQAYPHGHLIVACGLVQTQEGLMIAVNDPASPEEEKVKRQYPVKDLMRAWNRIIYRVRPTGVKG